MAIRPSAARGGTRIVTFAVGGRREGPKNRSGSNGVCPDLARQGAAILHHSIVGQLARQKRGIKGSGRCQGQMKTDRTCW